MVDNGLSKVGWSCIHFYLVPLYGFAKAAIAIAALKHNCVPIVKKIFINSLGSLVQWLLLTTNAVG